jgi:hypothetical protein
MYMRVTHIQTSPGQVEAAATDFKERMMPAAREAGGYAGSAFFVDRETGLARGVTYWRSSEALAATAEWAVPLEISAVGSTASSIVDVERFQMVLEDRALHPEASACWRVDNGYTSLTKQDAWVEFVQAEVVPVVRTSSGYCATAICIDRTSGAAVVTSEWATAADRDAAALGFVPVLRRAAEFALHPIRLEFYEQVVAELHGLDPGQSDRA